jgi:hypothetical protein
MQTDREYRKNYFEKQYQFYISLSANELKKFLYCADLLPYKKIKVYYKAAGARKPYTDAMISYALTNNQILNPNTRKYILSEICKILARHDVKKLNNQSAEAV